MRKLLLILSIMLPLIAEVRDSQSDSKAIKEGFYYYMDNNVTKKVKATPSQKMQADLTKELIKEMRENNRLQRKILKRLEKAFPDTIPEYTINKKTGEKCKSNSSADCFVMPVVKEAQNSVPVMAEMLRNPTSQNIKKYMEWQAVYFNQAFKIGKGFSLMSKQFEREINKMDGMSYTQMPTEHNKQNDLMNIQKFATIKKLDDKIGLMLFVGKSREHERNMHGKRYLAPIYASFRKMKNITYVFESEEDKQWVENKIKANKFDKDWEKYKKIKTVISPEYYKKFKINVTPASAIIYEKDNGEIIWQKLGYTISPKPMLRTIYDFLSFHGIVKPGAVNEKTNWENADRLREGKAVSDEFVQSIDINESSIDVDDSQYLKKNKKEGKDNEK